MHVVRIHGRARGPAGFRVAVSPHNERATRARTTSAEARLADALRSAETARDTAGGAARREGRRRAMTGDRVPSAPLANNHGWSRWHTGSPDGGTQPDTRAHGLGVCCPFTGGVQRDRVDPGVVRPAGEGCMSEQLDLLDAGVCPTCNRY